MDINQEIKLKYRDEFRSFHREAFQNWFEKLAVALHGEDCFLAISETRGDGGLDGLVLKEGRVYQVYAPPSFATDTKAAAKVKADFNKAKKTLGNALKLWTFVHNSSNGGLGDKTATALAQLNEENPGIFAEAIGIYGLWERLEKIPNEKLASLFGISQQPNQAESRIRALLKRASELANQDKRRQAFEAMEEALAIAESEKLVNLQAEVLIGLSLISSKRDGLGDRSHFFQQLQSLQSSLTEAPIMVMFHRANGAYLEEKRDLKAAESAYLAAITLASLPDNAESCDEQLCVAQSEYVNFLCNANRTREAEEHLQLAESYAKNNPEILNGEVFQAALNAGLHWAAKVGDEDGVIERINMLEASANTAYRALIIAGQLINNANNLSHIKRHRAALAASDAALRLTDKISIDTRNKFLPGALYTAAMVNFHAGRLEEALQKANSLVNIAETPVTASVRFAAAQLVSVISRQRGDFATAVVNSGDIDEMLEIHKNAVDNFMEKGYIPFNEYTREAVILATNQYYKSPYPRRQLFIAGITNSAFFLLSLLAFFIALRAAIISLQGS